MKHCIVVFSFLFSIVLISCNPQSSKVSEKPENNSMIKNPNKQIISGTYTGTTPCADCPGIKTTVIFNQDSTVIEQMKYLERNTSYSDTGRWQISDSIISISFPTKQNASNRYFKIKSDSEISMLDGDKKEIEGALAKLYVLKKEK